MILKVFSVYDCKVQAYMPPFYCRTTGEALRTWESSCNDGQSMMYKHPGDYTLFEIGSFDELSGNLVPLKAHVNLGKAIEVRKDLAPSPLSRSSEIPVLSASSNQ